VNPLTYADARALVAVKVNEVAPDVQVGDGDDDADLHLDFDLDSIDFLNLVVALHDATGIEIPERDYERLDTVRACADYLVEHVAVG
jgi:acyl carrier protein